MPVTPMRAETEERLKAWAEEQLRAALSVYRATYSSAELIERLGDAARTEAWLAERAS